jgi:hypothetical protein
MNAAKVILGIGIALVVIVVAGAVLTGGLFFSAGKAVAKSYGSPEKVSATASKIADFQVPDGFSQEYALEQFGITLAAYKGSDGHSHLMLAQMPEGTNDLESKLQTVVPGSVDRTTRLNVVERREATVRGQQATLVISDGTNSDGQPYRQLTTSFQGKNGPAILVISRPSSSWNQADVDQLIASIE